MKVIFAASSGGHLEQLLMLRPLMDKYDSVFVTEKTEYNVGDINKKTYYLKQINRKELLFPLKLLINFGRSFRIVLKEKPKVMITTGVLAIIPLALLVKATGGKLVYIESFAKVTSQTLSGKLLYRYADQFYVQWEEMLQFYPEAIYLGGIY